MKIKFFDIDTYINKLPKTWKLLCVCAPRNIGKSTSTWKKAIKDFLEKNKDILFLRNNDEQLAVAKQDFNVNNENYKMIGTHIFNMENETIEEKGVEKIVTKRGEKCGYNASINNFSHVKSMVSNNLGLIFLEEYNEKQTKHQYHIYENFINLITTIGRFNDYKIIMIGNKDDPNSDFHIYWNIDFDNRDVRQDRIIEFDKDCFFIEIGSETFKSLPNDKTLAYQLAQHNPNTKSYLGGDFILPIDRSVINYNKKVKNNFKPLFAMCYKEFKIIYAKLINDDTKYVCIDVAHCGEQSIPHFAMEIIGGLVKSSVLAEKEEILELLSRVYFTMRNNNLYFTSFDMKAIILELFKRLNVDNF